MPLASMLFEGFTYPIRRAIYGVTNTNNLAPELQAYCHSMKLKAAPSAETMGAFDNYVDSLPNTVEKFSDLKVGGVSLAEKIKDRKNLIAEFNNILNSKQLKAAHDQYNAAMGKVNAFFTNDEPYHPQRVTDTFISAKNTAWQAIKEHEKELTNFDKKFSQQFEKNLEDELGMTSGDITKLKTDMKSQLVAAHGKAVKDFEENTNKTETQLLKDQQKEMARLSLIMALFNRDEKMREELIAIVQSKKPTKGEVQAEFGDNSAFFKDLDIKDIANLSTITGRTISRLPDGKGFVMELPNLLFSSSYYRGSLDRMKGDMMSFALTVRASGYEAIKMNISHPNEKHRLLLAREAYAACRKVGYPDDKIKISLNGEVLKGEELHKKLFGSSPDQKTIIEQEASRFDKLRADRLSESKGASDYKKHTADMRSAMFQNRAQAAAASNDQQQSQPPQGEEVSMVSRK